MAVNDQFKTLFSPFQINKVKLKNRFVKSPQGSSMATEDGFPNEKAASYFESLAKGGVGLIYVEGTSIDFPSGVAQLASRRIDDPRVIPVYVELNKMIHSYDARVFIQLGHAGPAHSKKLYGLQPVSASSLTDDERPTRAFDQARAVTHDEIKKIQQEFVKASENALKAGFDGVELHGSHRYLINSFLSRAWNRREDEYGPQSLENQARFAVETISAIKKHLGSDFPVGIRINGQEWGLEKGITNEDSAAFARMFEQAGADFIHVSAYGYNHFLWCYWGEQLRLLPPELDVQPWLKYIDKPGLIVSRAENIKKAISIPVIGGGRITPQVAEWDLRHGKIDLFFMGRGLFADPEIPNKVAEGRLEDIAPCTACCECWQSSVTEHRTVQCRINASLGREREYEIKPAVKKKKVFVVGGGPSGMEAARVAAARGHDVTLYEKRAKLGGSLPLAAMIKGREVEDLVGLVRYLRTQITKAGVKINLGKEASLSLIQEAKPDVVILALGGVPVVPEIKGITNKKVLSATKLHPLLVGKRVIIIGGNIQGLDLAKFMVKRGRKVTVAEASDTLGADMVSVIANDRLIPWLARKGVTMMTGVKYEEITDGGLTVTTKDGKKQTLEADNILTALPLAPNDQLAKALQGKVPEVYAIGDCREPHRIIHAVHDGARVGHLI